MNELKLSDREVKSLDSGLKAEVMIVLHLCSSVGIPVYKGVELEQLLLQLALPSWPIYCHTHATEKTSAL